MTRGTKRTASSLSPSALSSAGGRGRAPGVRPDGDDHPPPDRELVLERGGHPGRGGGDDDGVEGRLFRPALPPVADAVTDVRSPARRGSPGPARRASRRSRPSRLRRRSRPGRPSGSPSRSRSRGPSPRPGGRGPRSCRRRCRAGRSSGRRRSAGARRRRRAARRRSGTKRWRGTLAMAARTRGSLTPGPGSGLHHHPAFARVFLVQGRPSLRQ